MPTKKQKLQARAAELGIPDYEDLATAALEKAIEKAEAAAAEPLPDAERSDAGRAPFRLGVVMKAWGRPHITRFVLDYFHHVIRGHELLPDVAVVAAVAVSPGDPNPHERHEECVYVEAPNRPLSPKGNAAVRVFEGQVDAVLNVGSDDLVSPAYVREAVDAILGGADLVLPEGLTFYDLSTGRAMAVQAPRIGAGRVLSSRLLERLDWQPWTAAGDSPDADMDERLRVHGGEFTRYTIPGAAVSEGLVVLDVKGHDNISSYDNVHGRRAPRGQAVEIDPAALWAALEVPTDDDGPLAHLTAVYGESRRPVRLVARVNIPGALVGLRPNERVEKRDAKGRPTVFEATPEQAALLVKHGYAVRAEGSPQEGA